MRAYSDQFKSLGINIIKVRSTHKNKDIILLFKVNGCDKVYDRNLDSLGNDEYGMNYNGEYIIVTIK